MEFNLDILYITQSFPPEPGPTVRPLKLAVHLQNMGHNLTFLTTMPYFPLGKVFKNYRRRLYMREQIEGIDVVRVWSLPAPNKGYFLRVLSQLSFAIAALMVGLFLKPRHLVIASVPYLATEMTGLLIARLKGSKVLLELRDLIPDNLVISGVDEKSFTFKFLNKYFRKIYKWVDLIAVVCDGMKDALIKRGIDTNRIIVLPHSADADKFISSNGLRIREQFKLENKFVVVYAGSFNQQYNIINIIKAMLALNKKFPQVHLLLIGAGTGERTALKMIEDNCLNNITFIGLVPYEQIQDYLVAADICISSHHYGSTNPEFFRNHLITKDCEYLMAGKPMIVIENSPDIGQFLENIESGTGVPISDPQALAKSIIFYAENPEVTRRQGRNAREYAICNLNREIVVEKFEKELREKIIEIEANLN